MLAIFTAHPQKAVIEATAFEEIGKFLPDEGRQRVSLGFQVGTKCWEVSFDELIEQRRLWPVEPIPPADR